MLRPRGGCILLNLSPVALGLAAYETFGQVMFAEVCGLAVREIMSGLPGLIVAEFNRVRVRVQVSTVQAKHYFYAPKPATPPFFTAS